MTAEQDEAPTLAPKVERYSPAIFDALNRFAQAKELLGRRRSEIDRLGRVIIKHGLHETLGVSLLHKHFPMLCDEVLVRHYDFAARKITMTPKRLRPGDNVIPYLWRATTNGSSWQFYPLEFVEAQTEGVRSLDLTESPEFLVAMAEQLAARHVMDVFGLAVPDIQLIRRSDDELLVETTDSEKRILTVTPEPRGDVRLEELTETLWTFEPEWDCNHVEGLLACTGAHCDSHCQSHCRVHCKSHCSSHCKSHCRDHAGD
jgi:hypothetical protein